MVLPNLKSHLGNRINQWTLITCQQRSSVGRALAGIRKFAVSMLESCISSFLSLRKVLNANFSSGPSSPPVAVAVWQKLTNRTEEKSVLCWWDRHTHGAWFRWKKNSNRYKKKNYSFKDCHKKSKKSSFISYTISQLCSKISSHKCATTWTYILSSDVDGITGKTRNLNSAMVELPLFNMTTSCWMLSLLMHL